MDGDGITDLVIARYGSYDNTEPGGVTVLLSDGAGGIRARKDTPVGRNLYTLVTGDLTGDGRIDALVLGTDPRILLLPGDGLGGFGPPVTFSGSASTANVLNQNDRLFVADLNDDGILDFGISRSDGYLAIYLGKGGGLFAQPRYFAVPVGNVAVADLNSDGILDLVVGGYVLLGLGGAEYSAPSALISGQPSYQGDSLAGPQSIGDFNQDGILDLVVGGQGYAPLHIDFGDGSGGFVRGPLIPQFSDPYVLPLAVADFDSDGMLDLALIRSGSLAVVRGVGQGLFEWPPQTPVENSAYSLVVAEVGDLNKDGYEDLIAIDFDAAGSNFVVLMNNRDGTFTAGAPQHVTNGGGLFAFADFNGDGNIDLAFPQGSQDYTVQNQITIFLGDGAGHFAAGASYKVGYGEIGKSFAADINRDGHPDLIFYENGGLYGLMSRKGGGFSATPTLLANSISSHFLTADLNGDGRLDVIDVFGNQIRTYIDNGSGRLVAGPTTTIGFSGDFVALGDFDGDGRIDIAMTSSFSNDLGIFFGDGTGRFGSPVLTTLSSPYWQPLAGKFGGDGHDQLVLSIGNYVLFNAIDGSRRMHPLDSFAVPASPRLAVDVTGDGKPDLVGTTYNTSPLAVWAIANTICQPRHLVVARNVSTCDTAGSPLAIQPIVRIVDDGENALTCLSDSVTASIAPGTGTSGAVLGGTTSAPIVAGLASFTNLSVDLPGRDYRLRFSHPNSNVTESREFSQSLAAPVITPPPQACTLDPNRFEAASGYDTYSWTLDGTIVGRLRAVTLPTLSTGTHLLRLTVTQDGCSASSTANITPSATPPPPPVSNNGPVPWGAPIQLSSSTVPGAAYNWIGPNGFTAAVQNPTVPNARPLVAGDYRLSVVVGGCASPAATTHVTLIPPAWCAGCAGPSFAHASRYFDAGDRIDGMVVGDFNGDGNLDAVVSHPQAVTFYPGDGGGSFGTGIDSPVPYAQGRLLAVDVNRDGILDLVTGTSVLLGTGDGHFLPAQPFAAGIQASEIAVGDFNEDGWPDVAMITYPSGIAIALGDGKGGFLPAVQYKLGTSLKSLVIADINGDHHRDIIAINSTTYPSTSFVSLFGDGAGGFVVGSSFALPDGTGEVAVGDFDGDGVPDIVAGGYVGFGGSGDLSIFKGTGNGTFTLVQSIPANFQQMLRVTDLDRDGRDDILFLDTSNILDALHNRGAFAFDPLASYNPGGYPVEIGFGDVDRDGLSDVVVAEGFFGPPSSLVVLRGAGGGVLEQPLTLYLGSGFSAMAAGDFNGDGHADVAALGAASFVPSVYLLLNDGNGSLSLASTSAVDMGSITLIPADFNGDGIADLATNTGVLLSNGNGGFSPLLPYPTVGTKVAVGDFNEDGKKDVVLANGLSGVLILLGDGLGGFTQGTTLNVANVEAILVGDFNHDGHDDLAVSYYTPPGGAISLFLGTGSGTFTNGGTVNAPSGFFGGTFLASGDFNGDGKLDLVLAGSGLWILLGDGAGSLSAPSLISSLPDAFGLLAGDFNGDGKLDLAVTPANSGQSLRAVSIFIGTGSGTFLPPVRYSTGWGAVGALADLDEDGRPDLLLTNNLYPPSMSILSNTGCLVRRLRERTAPSCPQPGSSLSPPPVIEVVDDGENVVACDAGQVTASIVPGTGAPGAVLGGTKAVNAVGGTVNFTTLSIDRAGVGYQLEFHHPVATPARTSAFTVGSIPSPPVAGSNGPVCLGSTLQLTASTVPGGVYRWTGPNGFVATVQNPTIPNVTMAAAGVYSVYVGVSGCISSASTTNVVVRPVPSAAITAPTSACPNTPGFVATVPDAGPGASYAWSISNGTITSGAGTRTVTFSSGYIGLTTLSVTVTDSNGCASASNASVNVAATCAMVFYTLPPCRILDTRTPNGPNGGPALGAQLPDRNFVLTNKCGIPATALAISSNITVTQPTSPGDLRIHAGGTPAPLSTSIYFSVGQTRANNAILAFGPSGDMDVRFDGFYGGTVQFILDVNGYFQ